MLEQPLEKKTGSIFGPPGTKRLIYFVDDLNMPTPDKYGTQSAIAILRQHKDYGGFYDLKTLRMKKLDNTQLVAAMNPTAGSFIVNPRLQRLFATFAVGFPSAESLSTIFTTFLGAHLRQFPSELQELGKKIVQAGLMLHKRVQGTFKKTATNFHYEFNIRHVAGVFQGLLMTTPAKFKEPQVFADCWVHEAYRVYGDRLVSPEDLAKFEGL